MFVFDSVSHLPTNQVALCTKVRPPSGKQISYDLDDFIMYQNKGAKELMRKHKHHKEMAKKCLDEHRRLSKEDIHYTRTKEGSKRYAEISKRYHKECTAAKSIYGRKY